MMSNLFTLGDLIVVGLAADIAGAVILALSFSTKSPEQMRKEVPTHAGGANFDADFTSVALPQGLLSSFVRQRAEARLGLILLVIGFALQGSVLLFDGTTRLTTRCEIFVAALLTLAVWVLAFCAFKTYVPWEERRMSARIPGASSGQ